MSALYRETFRAFLTESDDSVVGKLVQGVSTSGRSEHRHSQTAAWRHELKVLRDTVKQLVALTTEAADWSILLEYEIPRRQRRIDAVVLADGAIIPLEFKTDREARSGGLWQLREYALDLRDFHSGSRGRPIYPLLVVTNEGDTRAKEPTLPCDNEGSVHEVLVLTPGQLAEAILCAARSARGLGIPPLEAAEWDQAEYRPVLDIIEAATAIFAGHEVREIAHATAENLIETVDAIIDLAKRAQREQRRIICFITGAPGSGKTLAGLAAACQLRTGKPEERRAVFLSGNGPLVRILRAALAADANRRLQLKQREARRQVSAIIQNVHEFSKHYQNHSHQPAERIVIFDEAQRAWDAKQMHRKQRRQRSEPAVILDIMERFPDWCVVIAIVGPGQEIHNGEAGLGEWGRALLERPERWHVVVSEEALSGGEGMVGQRLFIDSQVDSLSIEVQRALHLRASVRSFRARLVGHWVDCMLSGDRDEAARHFVNVAEFPVYLTRNLEQARRWLKARQGAETSRGLIGLLASSGAVRLRAHGLELSVGFRRSYPFEEWFLAPADDVRSSCALEVAATEFECQGLELDWTAVCWGDDVTYSTKIGGWRVRRFVGSEWRNVSQDTARQLALNKYRVLLTRARKGMIIWVPEGDASDRTRDPISMNETAHFLRACGVPEMPPEP